MTNEELEKLYTLLIILSKDVKELSMERFSEFWDEQKPECKYFEEKLKELRAKNDNNII